MINWKLRFLNKTSLTAIVLGVVALAYQVLGLCGIVPTISQDAIITTAGMVINVLVLVGIVTDPTTKGLKDSARALEYRQPQDDLK